MASEGYGATGAAAPDAAPAQRSARDVMDDIRTTQKFGGRDGYPMPTDALRSMGGETVREASVRLKDRQKRLPVVGLLAPAAFMLLENTSLIVGFATCKSASGAFEHLGRLAASSAYAAGEEGGRTAYLVLDRASIVCVLAVAASLFWFAEYVLPESSVRKPSAERDTEDASNAIPQDSTADDKNLALVRAAIFALKCGALLYAVGALLIPLAYVLLLTGAIGNSPYQNILSAHFVLYVLAGLLTQLASTGALGETKAARCGFLSAWNVFVFGMGSIETLVVLTNSLVFMGLIQADFYSLGRPGALGMPPHDEPRTVWMKLLVVLVAVTTLTVVVTHLVWVVGGRKDETSHVWI